MNYIVLDLEWNQSCRGKEYTVLGLPFEIIQIGAVKLVKDYIKIKYPDFKIDACGRTVDDNKVISMK